MSDPDYKPRNPFAKRNPAGAAGGKTKKQFKVFSNPFERDSQPGPENSGFSTRDIMNGKYEHELGNNADIPYFDEEPENFEQPQENPQKAGKAIFKRGPRKSEQLTTNGRSYYDKSLMNEANFLNNPMANLAMSQGKKYIEDAVTTFDKNLDSWAARAFQGSFKQYFEVETGYVLKKLAFILFPFWQFKKPDSVVQYSEDEFPTPSQDQSSKAMTVLDPDLYIPMMAFTSYILLSCLFMGINEK